MPKPTSSSAGNTGEPTWWTPSSSPTTAQTATVPNAGGRPSSFPTSRRQAAPARADQGTVRSADASEVFMVAIMTLAPVVARRDRSGQNGHLARDLRPTADGRTLTMTTPGAHDRPVTGGTPTGAGPLTSTPVSGGHPTGTTSGQDVTARMAGTPIEQHVTTVRPSRSGMHVARAKTSAAATFALVFGLAALFCALTAILSPAALLFGVIGVVLGIVGLAMAKRPGVTGKGVAIGGLVTALLGLLLGGAVLAGASVLVNDERRLDQLQNRVDDLRDLPSTGELREELPG